MMADQSYQQQVPVHNPQRGAAAMAMPLAGDAAPPSAVPMTFGTDVASQSPDMGSRGEGEESFGAVKHISPFSPLPSPLSSLLHSSIVAVSVPKQNIASILIVRTLYVCAYMCGGERPVQASCYSVF